VELENNVENFEICTVVSTMNRLTFLDDTFEIIIVVVVVVVAILVDVVVVVVVDVVVAVVDVFILSKSNLKVRLLPKGDLKTRWIRYVPNKVNTFAWKVMTNSLPTRFNISRRGIDIESLSCVKCDVGIETNDHLFFA
ncbi:RNA-directed DNA polymerase, eukaryota, partial [Tanacetum coccineum]